MGCISIAIHIFAPAANAQIIDQTVTPNVANEGSAKSFTEQIGTGRGDTKTALSSAYIIARDPFRSIRRGRQLFQRKFTLKQGMGPRVSDGVGDMNTIAALGAGLSDSCSNCHGRPRGSAGFGGDVATRPDSRDAPHLFGVGLKEMLADEITKDLRATRGKALAEAKRQRKAVTLPLVSKGINYGALTAYPSGDVNTAQVRGVDKDLRVRPLFAHGGKFSIREFIIGAFQDEMGLQTHDPEFASAKSGGRVVTPAGLVIDGSEDVVDAPLVKSAHSDEDRDHVKNEIPVSIVDHLEFYLLNYFKPGTYEETPPVIRGRALFTTIGCTHCHIPDLQLDKDRRVADVETEFDVQRGNFNGLFATATPLIDFVDDGTGLPLLKKPKAGSFLVRNIFTDFKRHDLGPNFHERNYDGTLQKEFLTAPLWGVGSTAPYGHDGRSINLQEAILRHGGEALQAATAFGQLNPQERSAVLEFLNSLILFPPDDTASNLNPGNKQDPNFPQSGHGSIRLPALFNDPTELE